MAGKEYYSIDSHVPPPTGPIPRDTRKSYPFEAMEVGDSFFALGGDKKLRAINSASGYFVKTHSEMQFTSRKVVEEVDGITAAGVRTWRIA